MPGALFVMILLGCGDASDDCIRVAALPTMYSTASECGAAMATVVPDHFNSDWPVIAARCEPVPRIQIAAR